MLRTRAVPAWLGVRRRARRLPVAPTSLLPRYALVAHVFNHQTHHHGQDTGETALRSGDSAGWPAAVPDGHRLQNRSQADATFLVVGTRNDEDRGEYSDIDMVFGSGRYMRGKAWRYRHEDGVRLPDDGESWVSGIHSNCASLDSVGNRMSIKTQAAMK